MHYNKKAHQIQFMKSDCILEVVRLSQGLDTSSSSSLHAEGV